MTTIDDTKVKELIERARREIDEGLLPSCQLALAKDGELVAFETFGDATPSSRYVIFSCTKGIIAGAMWLLIGEGKLDPSQNVADLIPEFASNGKDVVTVEQVMTHTAGFPRAPMNPRLWNDRQARLEKLAQWRLNWEPGTKSEYHPTSAHWVLAEVIARVSGMDHRDFVRQRIADALGLSKLRVGVPPEEQGDVAKLELSGEPPSPDELEALFGVRELPVGEVTDDALMSFNAPEALAAGVPGGGGVSTAADVALYYQALLRNPGDLWDPKVLADGTGHVRNRLPELLFGGVPAMRTLGLIVAGDDGKGVRRGFGATTSPRTFGHNGAGGQVAWADPETGLSFSYVTNGLDRNPIRQGRRGVGLSSRAGKCVT